MSCRKTLLLLAGIQIKLTEFDLFYGCIMLDQSESLLIYWGNILLFIVPKCSLLSSFWFCIKQVFMQNRLFISGQTNNHPAKNECYILKERKREKYDSNEEDSRKSSEDTRHRRPNPLHVSDMLLRVSRGEPACKTCGICWTKGAAQAVLCPRLSER